MIMKMKHGAGLAANQVGRTIRMIIVRDTVMVNPEICKSFFKEDSVEGCLSFPGKQVTKKRSKKVVAKWLDLEGNKQKKTLYLNDAFVIQHEMEHIDGVTFLD